MGGFGISIAFFQICLSKKSHSRTFTRGRGTDGLSYPTLLISAYLTETQIASFDLNNFLKTASTGSIESAVKRVSYAGWKTTLTSATAASESCFVNLASGLSIMSADVEKPGFPGFFFV